MPQTLTDIYEAEVAFSELTECADRKFASESLKERITFTEAEATQWLEKILFKGHGEKYLGYAFDEFRIGDNGEEILHKVGGCRVWDYAKEVPPAWWKRKSFGRRDVIDFLQPLWLHLRGCFRGLVIDGKTRLVPFLSVDPDRHKNTPINEFVEYVKIVTRIFEEACPDYRLSGEVNPANGSSKLFAWPTRSDAIDIAEAKDIAADVHSRILEATGKNIECFGHNMKNIRLPLHPEKLTVIDSGLLSRANRRKGRERQKFETHSVAEFAGWRQTGKNLDHDTFFRVIRQCCQNLPEENAPIPAPEDFQSKSPIHENRSQHRISKAECQHTTLDEKVRKQYAISVAAPTTFEPKVTPRKRSLKNISARSQASIRELLDEPNSFQRQHKALLMACRQAKSVISEEDALGFIREHDLFTGEWSDNELKRMQRVRDILGLIAKSFDPAKCSGSGEHFEIDEKKFRSFTRSRLPGQIRKVSEHRTLTEFGEVKEYKRYVSATNDEIACWMAINEFCRDSSELGDGGVPEDRAEAVWRILHANGQIARKWCEKRWRLIRDYLHSRRIVFCDYQCSRDDSYCYKPWDNYPGVRAKKPRSGSPGSYRDLQKTRNNNRPKTESVFSQLEFRCVNRTRLSGPNVGLERPPP